MDEGLYPDPRRRYIDRSLLQVIDSRLPYREIGVGGLILMQAKDARSRMPSELCLLMVHLDEPGHGVAPTAVMAVLSEGFHFFDQYGCLVGKLPYETLVKGGLSMQWLPKPAMRMASYSGPGLGRDYSLDYPNGAYRQVVVAEISQLGRIPALGELEPPVGLSDYRKKLANFAEAVKNQDDSADRVETLASLIQDIPGLSGDVLEFLGTCSLDGISAIGNLLSQAKRHGKLDQACALVLKGAEQQWGFQHPSMRADPTFGSNNDYYAMLYGVLDVPRREPYTEESAVPLEDIEGNRLRKLLEAPPTGKTHKHVVLAELPIGQVVIGQTYSGNRYLVKVVDPREGMAQVMSLRCGDPYPDDGNLGVLPCSDLVAGDQMSTSKLVTSPLQKIFLVE